MFLLFGIIDFFELQEWCFHLNKIYLWPLKKSLPPENVPDSPEKILLDLPRRKIPGVLLHQGEVLKVYVASTSNSTRVSDVALQLPTGSGKTLVGLLIAEWRSRKFKERVVYLCPTNQLVKEFEEWLQEQFPSVTLLNKRKKRA